jgi:hypothetical protein
VILLLAQGNAQPSCAMPFVIDGGSATLMAGSTCYGLAGLSASGTPTAFTMTFTGGTTTLDETTLSVAISSVAVLPARSHSGPTQPGLNQVTTATTTESLVRVPPSTDGGP